MGSKLIKGFIVTLGSALVAVMLTFFVRDVSRIINWSSSGFVFSSVYSLDDDRTAFAHVDTSDFITSPVPADNDTLLTIADSTASLQWWIEVLELPHQPGKEAIITYLHGGIECSTLIKTRPVDRANFIAVIVLLFLRLIIFFAFITLAFWAFVKRPGSLGVRALTLYSFSMAAFMGLTYMPMFAQMASFTIPIENALRVFLGILTFFFSSFWLLLHFVFPHRSRLIQIHPRISYGICFLPQITLAILFLTPLADERWFGITAYSTIALQVFAGLLILRHKHLNADNNLEKRQTKLVFWGSGAGLVIFLVYILDLYNIYNLFRGMSLFYHMVVTNLLYILVLASPISLAYALRRYRLLEIQAKLKRGTQYLMMMGILLSIFIGFVYLIGILLLDSVGITSRTPTLLIALFLALGFAPAQKNIRRQLERKIFPERQKLRKMTSDFLQNASSMPDCDSLCGSLAKKLQETLEVETVHMGLKRGSNNQFSLPDGEEIPISSRGDLMRWLEGEGHPLLIDEAIASDKFRFAEKELEWMRNHDYALILPLKAHADVLGFLVLGHKSDREDFHPEELQMLQVLSDQFALTLQNHNLLEENLEKRRMESELQIARNVQMRFLPQSIPNTPGLEIEAKSTFCLEVAGDYYDIIPLDNGCTVLAVGDVSGKGAGAALLMASLQASLRAYTGLGLNLEELVSRINDLIDSNTEADQYITFFVAIYNPDNRTLTYVNAGHNFPIIIHHDKSTEELKTGGLILGAFPSQSYQQDAVQLQSGDLLFLYTDGISEAMNTSGEEFGEERLFDLLVYKSENQVKAIMDGLVEDVDKFRGDTPSSDDMTLLLARVK